MAEMHRLHCPGCKQLLPRMPDPDDYGDDELAYQRDVDTRWAEHDCPVLAGTGPRRKDTPERRPAGRKGSGRQTVRNYRYTCACDPPVKIRSGRRELAILCTTCEALFQREPSDSEVITRKEPAA